MTAPTLASDLAVLRAVSGLCFGILKGSALLPIIYLVARLASRAPASVRHLIWVIGLAFVLILPFFPPSLAPLQLPTPSAISTSSPAVESVEVSQAPGVPSRQRDGSAFTTKASEKKEAVIRAMTTNKTLLLFVAFVAWAAGAILVLIRFGLGLSKGRRFIREAEPIADQWVLELRHQLSAELGLVQEPDVRTSRVSSSPMAIGVRRAAIVLPDLWMEWTRDCLRVVLAHELAHVRRRDGIGYALSHVVCALYWFHPLAWGAARRLRIESEYACDDLVLSNGTKASLYARQLLSVALNTDAVDVPAPALAVAKCEGLERRLILILDPNTHRGPLDGWRKAAVLTPIVTCGLAILLVVPVTRDVGLETIMRTDISTTSEPRRAAPSSSVDEQTPPPAVTARPRDPVGPTEETHTAEPFLAAGSTAERNEADLGGTGSELSYLLVLAEKRPTPGGGDAMRHLTRALVSPVAGSARVKSTPKIKWSANEISPDELADPKVAHLSARDAIRLLRPTWVRQIPLKTLNRAIAPGKPGEHPFDNYADVVINNTHSTMEGLERIVASDITSAQFLSAADATTLYGIGYSNGAVVITTTGTK